MKHIIAINFAAVLLSSSAALAQVGIGNPTPDSTSILDLTNPNNKGLVLPRAASTSGMSNRVDGMLYYFNDDIFYKTTQGYNGLTPWKYRFNGNITNDVYYNKGGRINIGATDVTVRPEAPLQIQTHGSVSLSSNGSFMVGSSSGSNLVLNYNTIQTRRSGSSRFLYINPKGGDLVVGSGTARSNVSASRKLEELHVPSNTYASLVPAGSIMMWYGSPSNVPKGWAVCDGGTYPRASGSGTIQTPDLSGRFVVGAGSNPENTYVAGSKGGKDEVRLTESQMPVHNHGVNDPGHRHWYDDLHNQSEKSDNANDRTVGSDDETTDYEVTDYATTGITIKYAGGGQAHENRPRYHVIVYMMKL